MKTHPPSFHRPAQLPAAAGMALVLLAAAPVAQGFRTTAEPRLQAIPLAQPAEGDVVAWLSVPRLSLEAPIYEGIGSPTLARGAGHIPGTALPGEEGGKKHSVLALPRDSAAAAVLQLRLGEIITMRTLFGVRSYRGGPGRRAFPPPPRADTPPP